MVISYLDGAGVSYLLTAIFSGVSGLVLLVGSMRRRIVRRLLKRESDDGIKPEEY